MRQLKPHQAANRDAIIASLPKYGASLDASDTGSGKSTTFLAVCKALGAKPAIITRKSIISGWRDECAAMGIEPLFITNYEAALSEKFPFSKVTVKKTSRVVMNPATLMWEPVEHITKTFEWVIPEKRVLFGFDEVQSCRGEKTLNTQMLIHASARWKTCMLSATPFTTPREAYGIGLALRLFNPTSYYRWMLRHGMRKDPFGRLKFVGDMPSEKNRAEGLRIMEEIHHSIFPERGVRTRRKEIPGFPDEVTMVHAVDVPNPNAIEQMYLEMIAEKRKQDYERACEGVAEDLHNLVEPLAVTQNLRARQEAELAKCPAIEEMTHDALERGESVVVFVNFDFTIEALSKRLNTPCIIRGQRKGENNYARAKWIQLFQTNKQRVIIVNNSAGGAGINLHDPITQVPRTNLISPPWSAVTFFQLLGRTQRLGGGFSTRRLLFAAGTIEEKVLRRVQARMDNLEMLTDGDLDVTKSVTE